MGPKIIHILALVKFVPAAAAYHFCLTSPATISQPWSYNFSVSNWEWIWLSVLYVLFAFLHESSPFLPLLDATSETAIAPPTEGGEDSEDSHVKTYQELDIYSSCIFYIHMSTLVQKCFSVGTTPYHKFTDQKKCLSSKPREMGEKKSRRTGMSFDQNCSQKTRRDFGIWDNALFGFK